MEKTNSNFPPPLSLTCVTLHKESVSLVKSHCVVLGEVQYPPSVKLPVQALIATGEPVPNDRPPQGQSILNTLPILTSDQLNDELVTSDPQPSNVKY